MTARSSLSTPARIRAGWFLIALVLGGCQELLTLPDEAHVFGQYQTCIQRAFDTCVDANERCRSVPAGTHVFLVGVRRSDGEFLVAREGLDPVAGVLEGTRFRAETTVELPDVCGCPAQVTEIIEGELLAVPLPPMACTPVAGDVCASEPPSTSGVDEGDAVTEDEMDFERRYSAIRGRIINEVRAIGEQDCTCLPCRAEFDFTGRP